MAITILLQEARAREVTESLSRTNDRSSRVDGIAYEEQRRVCRVR